MSIISKQIFLFSLVFIKFCISESDVFRIPFGLYKARNYNSDVVHDIFYNILYANLSVGTPPQNIRCELRMNSQIFTICNKTFNKNNSSTYEELSEYENDDDNNDIAFGNKSMDILNINNKKEKINFILSNKLKYDIYLFGIIGFSIPKNIEDGVYTFFSSLKKAQLINSYTWTLKFYNNISLMDTINGYDNNIGELIFGNEPHNYEKDKNRYNKTQLIKINPISSYELSWDINFDNFYLLYHDNENDNQTKVNIMLNGRTRLMPGVGFIFMPKEFNYIINKRFFDPYFKENICRSKYINDSFYGTIECDNNSSFKIDQFPDLCFEHKEFETTFNFTYKDLFVYNEKDDKYIFLMITDKYLYGWIFGSIFLKKYQLIFNQDSKTIGYYKSMNYNPEKDIDNMDDNNDNNDNNNNGNNHNIENNNDTITKYIIIGLLLIVFSVLLISIGMFFQKKFFSKKKKIKVNELEDEILFDNNS